MPFRLEVKTQIWKARRGHTGSVLEHLVLHGFVDAQAWVVMTPRRCERFVQTHTMSRPKKDFMRTAMHGSRRESFMHCSDTARASDGPMTPCESGLQPLAAGGLTTWELPATTRGS